MANTKSAEKRIRQSLKRRARNRAHRSTMKTTIKALRVAVASGDAGLAGELLPKAVSILDAMALKGVIQANAAARTKSRLTRAVAALNAA